MHRVDAVEHRAHTLGQRLIGAVHVGEQGVAAVIRHLARIQHGPQRRFLEEAEIRMPGIAEGADVALVRLLQHCDDIRVIRQVLNIGRAADGAKPARECNVLLRRQVLVMEEQHEPIMEGPFDFGERRIVERLRKVHAMDIGAKRASHRPDLDTGVGLSHGPDYRRSGRGDGRRASEGKQGFEPLHLMLHHALAQADPAAALLRLDQ